MRLPAGMEAPESDSSTGNSCRCQRARCSLKSAIWTKHSRSVTWIFLKERERIKNRSRKGALPKLGNFIPVQEEGEEESVRLFLAQQKYFYRAGKTGLMEQSQGNRSVPVSAGSWRTSNGRKQRNPRSGAGKRTVDQRKRRRKREINER